MNVRKTWMLMSVFFLLVIGIGWGIGWYMQEPLILYGAVFFALSMNIYSYWNSDKLVLKMTHAREADIQHYPELHRLVENLAITAGLPKPRVYVVEDPAPNAFATGRDPAHGVVAVTTGLLGILDKAELEGVLAHELSHIGNRDILVGTVAVVLAGFIAIVADVFIRFLAHGGGRGRGKHGVVVLIFVVIVALLAPLGATLIRLAVSRKREFLADASGALLTRYPEGLASALTKISAHGKQMQYASNATAHLFIADPFFSENGIKKKFNSLYATHPPVSERVEALVGPSVIA
jgi:heat shock protein HtpX